MASLRTVVCVAALAVISVASRLPELRSPNLLADGDECVLGLMAKHLAQGKEFPIFFYGQHYAFSPVEAAAGALSFHVAGVGPVPLKVAGLALWTLGVLFLFLAQARLVGPARSFWVTILLILNPGWAVWSLRAGGGYLTSFVAGAMLAWLLVQDRERETFVRWLIAGALTSLIYLAQPLWLPGVVPIVAVALALRRRLSWAVAYVSVATVGILLVRLGTATTDQAWGGPALGNPDLVGSLSRVARQIYVAQTGSHYLYWAIDPPGRVTTTLAVIWCVVLVAVALLQVYRLLTRRFCAPSHLLFSSLCATLVAQWALLSARDPRYLLPVFAILVPLAGVELLDLVDRRVVPRRAAAFLTAAMVVAGSLSMGEFSAFNYLWKNPPSRWTEAKRLQQLLGYLQAEDVRRVFSMNGMLDSQLVFYSNERVLSRWADPVGRYPPYVREVDRALANGEAVAVVGYTNQSGAPGCWDVPICTGGIERLVPNPESIFTVDDKYFVYVARAQIGSGPRATRELLTKLGFRFWDEKS